MSPLLKALTYFQCISTGEGIVTDISLTERQRLRDNQLSMPQKPIHSSSSGDKQLMKIRAGVWSVLVTKKLYILAMPSLETTNTPASVG